MRIKLLQKRQNTERNIALRVALGILASDPLLTKEQRDALKVDVFTAHREGGTTQVSGVEAEGAEFHFPIRSRR